MVELKIYALHGVPEKIKLELVFWPPHERKVFQNYSLTLPENRRAYGGSCAENVLARHSIARSATAARPTADLRAPVISIRSTAQRRDAYDGTTQTHRHLDGTSARARAHTGHAGAGNRTHPGRW